MVQPGFGVTLVAGDGWGIFAQADTAACSDEPDDADQRQQRVPPVHRRADDSRLNRGLQLAAEYNHVELTSTIADRIVACLRVSRRASQADGGCQRRRPSVVSGWRQGIQGPPGTVIPRYIGNSARVADRRDDRRHRADDGRRARDSPTPGRRPHRDRPRTARVRQVRAPGSGRLEFHQAGDPDVSQIDTTAAAQRFAWRPSASSIDRIAWATWWRARQASRRTADRWRSPERRRWRPPCLRSMAGRR